MFFLFLLLHFLSNGYSFTIDFPYGVNFMAKVSKINLLKLHEEEKEELRFLFKTTPVLVFENQDLTPKQHLQVSTYFDKNHLDDIMHPFKETMVPDAPQVAIRGRGTINNYGLENALIRNSKAFKYNELWHQDLVGIKNVLPNVVSSMYMIKTPEKGGSTKFASLENAYENLPLLHKNIYESTIAIYYSKNIFPEFDFTCYFRIDKFKKKESEEEYIKNRVISPLVIYPDESSTKKSIMLTPNRLFKFKDISPFDSHERMRHLMKNYVLVNDNVGNLDYKEKDLVIFNNRKVIHTSTPTEQYEEDRIMSLLFLGTKTPMKFLHNSL